MASNLPPGVNAYDIPGNRPEDEAWDKIVGEFYGLHKQLSSMLDNPAVAELVEDAIQFGIDIGKEESEQSHKESEQNQIDYLKNGIDSLFENLEYLKRGD